MPRSSSTKRSSGKKAEQEEHVHLVVPPEEEEEETIRDAAVKAEEGNDPFEERQGVFEFVVLSFVGVLPTEAGYDREKDRLMIGFRYGNRTSPSWVPSQTPLSDITAYDFLTNPRTGKRPGQLIEPHGCGSTDLTKGINTWTDLPPLFIWKQGMWLSQLLGHPEFDRDILPTWIKNKVEKAFESGWTPGSAKTPPSIYPYYVTSGEGTTGNNLYRIFEIPEEVCSRNDPHHPLMWSLKLKMPEHHGTSDVEAWKGESWRPNLAAPKYGSITGPAWGGNKAVETKTTTPVTKAPQLPAGLRYRCGDCGHWFMQGDLVGHNQVCPAKNDGYNDWAIMCHANCGCLTLDEVVKPKPGFPRPKPEPVEEKEVEEVVPVGAGTGAD